MINNTNIMSYTNEQLIDMLQTANAKCNQLAKENAELTKEVEENDQLIKMLRDKDWRHRTFYLTAEALIRENKQLKEKYGKILADYTKLCEGAKLTDGLFFGYERTSDYVDALNEEIEGLKKENTHLRNVITDYQFALACRRMESDNMIDSDEAYNALCDYVDEVKSELGDKNTNH